MNDEMRELISILENTGEDRFTGSRFADDEGNEYSVEAAYALAQRDGRFIRNFPIDAVAHDLRWWDGGVADGHQSHAHMLEVDTAWPILVLQQPDGLSVADGLNRLKKARDVEHRRTIPAYILPWTIAAKDTCRMTDQIPALTEPR